MEGTIHSDSIFERIDGVIELYGESYAMYRMIGGETDPGINCGNKVTLELPARLPTLKEALAE